MSPVLAGSLALSLHVLVQVRVALLHVNVVLVDLPVVLVLPDPVYSE